MKCEFGFEEVTVTCVQMTTPPVQIRVTSDDKLYAKDGEELKYHILHQRVVVLSRRGSRTRLLFFLPYKLVACGSPPPIISRVEYEGRSTWWGGYGGLQ